MTSHSFPPIRPDGTFSVEMELAVPNADRDFAVQVKAWVAETWMPTHAVWTREWRTGADLSTVTLETLRYGDTFSAAPSVGSTAGGTKLRFTFDGKNRKAPWKDWIVSRFLHDLKARFPEIGDPSIIRPSAKKASTAGHAAE